MSLRVDTSSLIAGAVVCGNRGLGVTGAVIRATTATGTHGAGWLYDDWDDSGDDAKEFRLLVETPPADGELFVYEDGSFSWAPDSTGTRTCVARLFVDGADQGAETNTLVSGDGSATGAMSATEATDTAAVSGSVLVSGSIAATEAPDTALVLGDGVNLNGGGAPYDDAPKPRRKKLTVLHKDDRAEKEAEFEALLARVSGQAQAKAKEAASKPIEITKPPRMPEIRGVDSFYLRQYLPDLIGAFDQAFQAAYQAEKQAQIDAMAQAQAAIARAKFEAEEEEIALLAMLL